MLLKSDSISLQKILQNCHNLQMQWHVVSTLCQKTKKHQHQNSWIRRNTKIGPALEVATCCLHGKYGIEIRISHDSCKLVTNLNNREQETSEVQFKEYALRLYVGDFASRLKAKAKPQKREPAGPSIRTYQLGKELGPTLTQENIHPPVRRCRRNWFIFFDMQEYKEKTKERLILENKKMIFRNIFSIVIIGLTTSGRKAWQEEEETRKDTSIVLNHHAHFFTSELFKVIQNAISLILLCKTMSLFRTSSASTFIMSDVQSIYISSSIRDWYREVKFWATNRQYSFCLWIPWTKP